MFTIISIGPSGEAFAETDPKEKIMINIDFIYFPLKILSKWGGARPSRSEERTSRSKKLFYSCVPELVTLNVGNPKIKRMVKIDFIEFPSPSMSSLDCNAQARKCP